MKNKNFIKDLLNKIYLYFIKICICIYKFIKYVWYGLLWPIVLVVTLISKVIIKSRENKIER